MKKLLREYILRRLWHGVAKRIRMEKPYIIAMTGTVGKTSAKEAIALVLNQAGRTVLKTSGNMNTETGVALSLLGFSVSPKGLHWLSAIFASWFPPTWPADPRPCYIVEFSADKPGDISFLAGKLPFQAGVLTVITPVHMQFYANLDQLIAEKTSLFQGLQPDGYAVLNADDPNQTAVSLSLPKVIWYGIREKPTNRAGVWARNLELTDKGLAFQLDFIAARKMDSIAKEQPHSLTIQSTLIGRHQVYSLLAAAAVGFGERVAFAKIKKALEEYVVPNGRGKIIAGQKDTLIVDDSYNASPAAVVAGLRMLRPLAKKRRVVAILGRMNELGDLAETAHKEVARAAAGSVDYLVAVGQYEKLMLKEAKAAGLAPDKMLGFATTEQLADKLEQFVRRGDLLYFKGSQNGVQLERAVKRIMARPQDAQHLLVRQYNQNA
ncbi:UDP-N-acetylmuramoyl-tripeptide--D-alanyl-D-alanine ligase [Patescibacteria group bacterium]|nr:UDP-N-acetylmuramoyl-tripeptide--D-alanyl-D-alanine ligase [Patescibacteria group bacterium]